MNITGEKHNDYLIATMTDANGNTSKYSNVKQVVETTPPSPITTLNSQSSQQIGPGKIKLSWLSPGNDGNSDSLNTGSKFYIATTTVLSQSIDNSYWAAKGTTTLANVKISTSGVNPGTIQSYMLTGLKPGATYYIRIWTSDERPNWSGMSNCTTIYAGVDYVSPGTINTLGAAAGSLGGQIRLSWTSPGNDNAERNITGGRYRIRYATYNVVSWDAGTWTDYRNRYNLEIDTNTVPGRKQYWTLGSLSGGATYYFHIWTRDDNNNWSGISMGATNYAKPYTVFIVSTTADSGLGSLRQAIIDANTNTEPNVIKFNIPNTDIGYNSTFGVWRIVVLSTLPALSDNKGVIIDGTSQKAFIGSDTNPYGPEIEIFGRDSLYAGTDGLIITSSSNTVKGIIVSSFTRYGIHLNGTTAKCNTIIGNYVGICATGTVAMMNKSYGIYLNSSPDNIIGGITADERNIVSGNYRGIYLRYSGCKGNKVIGNYVGTDRTGTKAVPNSSLGIEIDAYPSYNRIGGASAVKSHRPTWSIFCNLVQGLQILSLLDIQTADKSCPA